eukprot:GEMP01082750.1.p1 GENE.GEMP01082750.1~~GEMP01082750.1.p1  ORF type:complete len:269 (+),score=116.14 GEMP01082750.1:169-975(+)
MADLSWHQNRIREGTRGGREEFKWDQVKELDYKDRECYLGASTKIGMMGKLGRWNEQDWYAKQREKTTSIDEERIAVRKFEEELMQEALGLKPKKLLLAKQQMTPEQMKEYFKEQKKQAKEERVKEEEGTSSGAVQGLGFAPHRTAELEEKKTQVLGTVAELVGEGDPSASSSAPAAVKVEPVDAVKLEPVEAVLNDVPMARPVKEENENDEEGSSSSPSDDAAKAKAKKANRAEKKRLKKEKKKEKKKKKKEKRVKKKDKKEKKDKR